MFTKEKAAQYLIVGWCKHWKMKTYLAAICEGENLTIDQIIKHFPFMPNDEFNVCRKNMEIRPFVAKLSKKLSDKLFDAKTDSERLSFFKELLKIKSPILDKSSNGAVREFHAEQKRTYLLYEGERLSLEEMRRGGRHWKVCK